MNPPIAKSLYRQLLFALVVLVMLASVFVSLVNFYYTSRESKAIFDSKVLSYSNSLHDSLEWPLWNVDDELVNKVGSAFASNADISSLTILDDQKRIVFQHVLPNVNQIKRVVVIEHQGASIGTVELGLSLRSQEEKNKWFVINGLISSLLLIVFLLLSLRLLLARLLKKPVDVLVGVIGEVVEGKYPQITPEQTYAEFAPIVSGFKVMSETVANREASLRASEQKLLNILEGVDAFIYLKDLDGCYLFANRPVRELWHAEMKDIVGFTDEKFFDAATAANIRLNDNRILIDGETVKTEEVNTVRATGETFFYQSTKLPLRREDGTIFALCGISINVTERKQVEEALRNNEERLKLATSAGGIGIWDWNIAENILVWDESMFALYGIRREDFTGAYDAWTCTLHPDDRQLVEGEIQAALRGEREYALEFRIVRPDGSVRNIKCSSKTSFDENGKPVRMIGTNYDITEIKRIEGELRQYKDHLEEEVQQRTADLVLARDAAEAANIAKSTFLASMSHELRTPLNAILGFSSLLQRDERLNSEQRNNLDIINRSGSHLLTIINDVLEMSKIEAGRTQLVVTSFDLGVMVRDVTDMMEIRAREKGLHLLLDQASEFPRYIQADEARLRQILINLLGNAVKFTEQGGVTLRLGSRKNAITHLIIEVEDSGRGISAEDQKRLFQPFVQLGKQAGDNQGTGLGLSITRQFVQLMGGTIIVESTPGKGSLFRIELPLSEVKDEEVNLPQTVGRGEVIGLAPDQPDFRILIVEDQHENQLLLTQLMQRVGFTAKVADNGEQAVKLFQSWQPHLIWMDRRMSGMDGLDATKLIRTLPGGKEVKIVAVTASAFVEERAELLAAGMDDFVRKPYPPVSD